MKTVKDVQKEIADIKSEVTKLDKSKEKKDIALRKRLRGKLPQLKQYVLYLETSPTKEYCEKEVDRISNRINEIMKLYIPLDADRFKKGEISAHKKSFEKQWDIPKVRKQLMAISYILK